MLADATSEAMPEAPTLLPLHRHDGPDARCSALMLEGFGDRRADDTPKADIKIILGMVAQPVLLTPQEHLLDLRLLGLVRGARHAGCP